MKEITLRVLRFDPEKDSESHFETYKVTLNDGARSFTHFMLSTMRSIRPSPTGIVAGPGSAGVVRYE